MHRKKEMKAEEKHFLLQAFVEKKVSVHNR